MEGGLATEGVYVSKRDKSSSGEKKRESACRKVLARRGAIDRGRKKRCFRANVKE